MPYMPVVAACGCMKRCMLPNSPALPIMALLALVLDLSDGILVASCLAAILELCWPRQCRRFIELPAGECQASMDQARSKIQLTKTIVILVSLIPVCGCVSTWCAGVGAKRSHKIEEAPRHWLARNAHGTAGCEPRRALKPNVRLCHVPSMCGFASMVPCCMRKEAPPGGAEACPA